ncbi:MAG: type II secretion system F family protein [Candidatus Bathyarchaeia archaeon]
MKHKSALRKIKALFTQAINKIKASRQKLLQKKTAPSQPKTNFALGSVQSLAYSFFGEKIGRVMPLFTGLDVNLQRAKVKVNFKAYVSLTVFSAFLASIVVFVSVPLILYFFGIPTLPAVLFGIGSGLFAFAFSIIAFYGYPVYRADKLKRDLEDELPFTAGYMAILTSAGVPPEKIFYSLSNLSVPLAVSAEAKDVVRDVSLFGKDIISALEESSKRTPSERFREMLEGFIATIHSGSNTAAYLREKSKEYMKLKRIGLKKFSDTLSVLSEFYVAILLTGPLLMVIMLAVMVMLGGGNLGLLSPELLLSLLTYIGLPLGAVVFLIILDAVTPKW